MGSWIVIVSIHMPIAAKGIRLRVLVVAETNIAASVI
jgi:hypothetical protein